MRESIENVNKVKFPMAQFSIIVSDDIGKLINEVADQTGRSISSLCADYLEEGVYRHIEQLNKVEVWRGQIDKRKRRESESAENQ
jgi:predicted transcriptional regulator